MLMDGQKGYRNAITIGLAVAAIPLAAMVVGVKNVLITVFWTAVTLLVLYGAFRLILFLVTAIFSKSE